MDIRDLNLDKWDLNPLGLADAWWQHAIMLAGAGIIGYIIGFRTNRRIASELEEELEEVERQLDTHRNQTPINSFVPETQPEFPVEAAVISTMPTEGEEETIDGPPDNLKVIEGIGPKIEQLLQAQGISTYRQLSLTKPEDIVAILYAAGSRFKMHDPTTWPQQAELAADNKWQELETLQKDIKGGQASGRKA